MTSPEDTPPQPPSLDNRPGGVATAEPAATPAASDDQSGSPHRRETLTLPEGAMSDAALPGASPTGDQPRKRRRRRRRRKGPRPEGAPALGAASTTASPEGQTAASADGNAPPQANLTTEAVAGAAETAPTGGEQPGTAPGGEPQRRRRRRRRRRGKRPEGAPGAAGSAPAEGQVVEGTTHPVAAGEGQSEVSPAPGAPQQPGGRPREHRGRNNRGPRRGPRNEARARDDRPREGGEAARDRGPNPERRERDGQNKGPRDRDARGGGKGPRDRDRGPRGPGGKRPFGKGRDAPRDRPQPKLYSIESVVDRGFEDVAVEAAPAPAPDQGAELHQALEANQAEAANQEEVAIEEEAVTQEQEETSTQAKPSGQGGTRRIEWTIVKRTLADQRAAKAVSAVYVLKRDGVDTEFANLAAARAAVNKTIVHPEKLTRAKADYGSTKK